MKFGCLLYKTAHSPFLTILIFAQ